MVKRAMMNADGTKDKSRLGPTPFWQYLYCLAGRGCWPCNLLALPLPGRHQRQPPAGAGMMNILNDAPRGQYGGCTGVHDQNRGAGSFRGGCAGKLRCLSRPGCRRKSSGFLAWAMRAASHSTLPVTRRPSAIFWRIQKAGYEPGNGPRPGNGRSLPANGKAEKGRICTPGAARASILRSW